MTTPIPRIYLISGAPRAWRVLLAFAFKGLRYEPVFLSGSDREHKAHEFLALNPHGKVPVMEYKGYRLRESLSIISWLDTEFPTQPILGSTAQETAEIWTLAALFSDYLLDAVNGVVGPAFLSDGTPPAQGSPDKTSLQNASDLLESELSQLTKLLGKQPFLHGARPTAADAVVFAEIGRLMRALETRAEFMSSVGFTDFDNTHSEIAAWRDRVIELPGVPETYPPHWASRTSTTAKNGPTT